MARRNRYQPSFNCKRNSCRVDGVSVLRDRGDDDVQRGAAAWVVGRVDFAAM
jgi:hypothetical protein